MVPSSGRIKILVLLSILGPLLGVLPMWGEVPWIGYTHMRTNL